MMLPFMVIVALGRLLDWALIPAPVDGSHIALLQA
jgi:hypothetical protein